MWLKGWLSEGFRGGVSGETRAEGVERGLGYILEVKLFLGFFLVGNTEVFRHSFGTTIPVFIDLQRRQAPLDTVILFKYYGAFAFGFEC